MSDPTINRHSVGFGFWTTPAAEVRGLVSRGYSVAHACRTVVGRLDLEPERHAPLLRAAYYNHYFRSHKKSKNITTKNN